MQGNGGTTQAALIQLPTLAATLKTLMIRILFLISISSAVPQGAAL